VTPPIEKVETRDLAWEVEATAAILDLVVKLALATDVKAGCRVLVDQLQQHTGCQIVAIGLKRSESGTCRLLAASGRHDFDSRAPLPRALEQMLQAAVSQSGLLAFHADDDHEGRTPLEVVSTFNVSGAAGLIAAPLRTAEGETIGAWLFLGDATFASNPIHRQFVSAAGETIAAGLKGLQQGKTRLWSLPKPAVPQRFPLRRIAVTLALAAAAALWIPWDYKIACECKLEPATRRYVAAQFAGVFEKSLVQPGELVALDQVLGRMDGKEIRWELATVAAERERVAKSHDVNLAAGKVAAAQIDRLEVERLEQKRQLLEHRAAHLEIKSPLKGIVLSGDLKRSEGMPLTIGQRLFEIAPLEKIVVEVVVPDDEVALVAVGQAASVRLDAYPGRVWEGSLERLHPRSEVRDDKNVFIAEVALDNAEALLRPGMEGRAKIVSGPQRLGWILFHEPYYRLASWLGW
jgi:multidrug resistance efflux pump